MTEMHIVPTRTDDMLTVFTERDRQMLSEVHEAITGIRDAINQLPLDKLSKSPIFRMMGL